MCSGSCWILAEGNEFKLKKNPSHSLKSENRHCPEADAFENHHLVEFCCNKFGLCKLRGMSLGFFSLFGNDEGEQKEFAVGFEE